MPTMFDEFTGASTDDGSRQVTMPPRERHTEAMKSMNRPGELESSNEPASTPSAEIDFVGLVERIRRADPTGMEDLYRIFSRGVRYYLCRQLGAQELEDKVHDTFLIVVQAIRRGDLREPEKLMGFIRTIVRRQVAAHIESAVQSRRDKLDIELGVALADDAYGPEENAILQQKAELMEKILRGLNQRDREILTRFYLDEQSQEQICEEMKLTDTQFRLLKSRAKNRFGELGRKKLARRPIRSFFLRTSLSA